MARPTPLGRHQAAYRLLLRLYPRELRTAYGPEMVQVFGDLVRERGRSTWGRVALDLAVSVPRSRLESLMHRSPTYTDVTLAILAVGILASAGAVLVFGPLGLPVPVIVAAIALSQRSKLAHAVGPDTRRHRTWIALVGLVTSAVTFLGTLTAWIVGVDRGYGFDDAVLMVFNLLAFGSLIATTVFGIAFFSRRRAQRASSAA